MSNALKIHWPGLLLLTLILLIGLGTYQEYGVTWDDPEQSIIGRVNYNYVFNNDSELLTFYNRDYGAGFELLLKLIEKRMHIADSRDEFLMRHIVTHLFFFVSICFFYLLSFRLFGNRILSCLAILMYTLTPRIYAHSFFNTKDVPFLSAFVIGLALSIIAVQSRRTWLYALAGVFCGFATGIRVMGVMLFVFVAGLILSDFLYPEGVLESRRKQVGNLLVYVLAFCVSLFVSWPYLWESPIVNFVDCFKAMSHFRWVGTVFMNGNFEKSDNLPWFIFPVWFVITNPVLWLVAGFAGIALFAFDFFRKPLTVLKDKTNRILLLCLLCFVSPVVAVVGLHAVIYEDWRHLFFVCPPFLVLALYFINRISAGRFKLVVYALVAVQVLVTSYTMFIAFPFNQVYFNPLVSHEKEYLRRHYEMDYWGVGFKEGLEYLLRVDERPVIKLFADRGGMAPMINNALILQSRDRARISFVSTASEADYQLTDFRCHPDDFYDTGAFYTIRRFNSNIICIYKLR